MERRVTILAGCAVAGLAVALVVRGLQTSKPAELPTTPVASVVDAAPGPVASPTASTGAADAAPLLLSDLLEPTPTVRDDAGGAGSLLDGAPVPPLPATAPRQVRFGIVLVSYEGAQPSGGGGHPANRSRAEAKALAEKLLAGAQEDFHAAVQQGDLGSADDVGRVKLGILEPAPEYVLFTLPVHGVGGPVDTPRGYWIVKRLE